MKLDFSAVEEFVPVAVGRYLAEIEKSSEGVSERAGQRKWSLAFTVLEQPEGMKDKDGEDIVYVGKKIKWDISLQSQALWKVMQTVQALGDDVTQEDTDFDFDATGYVGRKRRHYGEEALVELAMTMAVCRVFPITKRALGYAQSCSKMTVQV